MSAFAAEIRLDLRIAGAPFVPRFWSPLSHPDTAPSAWAQLDAGGHVLWRRPPQSQRAVGGFADFQANLEPLREPGSSKKGVARARTVKSARYSAFLLWKTGAMLAACTSQPSKLPGTIANSIFLSD